MINGYRTGDLGTDLMSFRVKHLHKDLGLNVANVTLPLHGPRALGETSGARVLNAGAMNTINTIAHGAWDIRRVLAWLRTEMGAQSIGISGISLGGYMVSLVSCLDDDLACVIAGVPESDLVRGMRRQIEPLLPPFYEQWGLSWGPLERVFTPVSPLAMHPWSLMTGVISTPGFSIGGCAPATSRRCGNTGASQVSTGTTAATFRSRSRSR